MKAAGGGPPTAFGMSSATPAQEQEAASDFMFFTPDRDR